MNLAKWDRWIRVGLAAAGGVGAVVTPWPLGVACGATALYLLGSALKGTCAGYHLLGVSTCPRSPSR